MPGLPLVSEVLFFLISKSGRHSFLSTLYRIEKPVTSFFMQGSWMLNLTPRSSNTFTGLSTNPKREYLTTCEWIRIRLMFKVAFNPFDWLIEIEDFSRVDEWFCGALAILDFLKWSHQRWKGSSCTCGGLKSAAWTSTTLTWTSWRRWRCQTSTMSRWWTTTRWRRGSTGLTSKPKPSKGPSSTAPN